MARRVLPRSTLQSRYMKKSTQLIMICIPYMLCIPYMGTRASEFSNGCRLMTGDNFLVDSSPSNFHSRHHDMLTARLASSAVSTELCRRTRRTSPSWDWPTHLTPEQGLSVGSWVASLSIGEINRASGICFGVRVARMFLELSSSFEPCTHKL